VVADGMEGGAVRVLASDLPPALWPSVPLRLLHLITMGPVTILDRTGITLRGAMRIMARDITARDIIAHIIGRMDIGNDKGPVSSGPFCGRGKVLGDARRWQLTQLGYANRLHQIRCRAYHSL